MPTRWDLIVLGAGPAGGNAARVAASRGAKVLLIDEQKRPGGQVWRARSGDLQSNYSSPETRAGDAHREALKHCDVTFSGESRLWHIELGKDGWQAYVLRPSGTERFSARAVILAPGAREFVQPFPGWTTPGVFGLAGVTALIKSQQISPGHRCVVAGGGPLAIFAAIEILRLGGNVSAIVTPNSRLDWLKCLPALLSSPILAARGVRWIAQLRRAGVPILWRHLVTRAEGNEALASVIVARCTAEWTPVGEEAEYPADTLCIGNGLLPNSEVAALAGLELRYEAADGGWIAPVDQNGQTEIPGLFLCGDGAKLRGAAAATKQGSRVGHAAARWLEGGSVRDGPRRIISPNRTDWFGQAMNKLTRPRPGLQKITTSETIVCRCEDIPRATLDAELNAGAASIEALKSATRCGMGPCGGRYCLTGVARLAEQHLCAKPGSLTLPTPRPPLFPLPIAAVGSDFDYDNLPMPNPAPL